MIRNLTTDVSYNSLAAAIAGLPATLDMDYSIEVTGEQAGIAGFAYSGNCSTFKLTIQTPDQSVIDGGGGIAITFSGSSRHNIELNGFTIQNFVNGGVYVTNSYGSYSDYLLKNLYLTGTGTKAIRIVSATSNITLEAVNVQVNVLENDLVSFNPARNVLVTNCILNQVGATSNYGIYGFTLNSITIEDTALLGMSNAGIYLKTISGEPLIDRCTFQGGVGYGVQTSSGLAAITIRNCLFQDQGAATKPPIYLNTSALVATLENNTLACDVASLGNLVYMYGINTLHAFNNVVDNRNSTATGVLWDIRYTSGRATSDYDSDYNLFYRVNSGNASNLFNIGVMTPNGYASLATLQAAGKELNSLYGDPLFNLGTVPWDPDYLLQDASPGHNAATDTHLQEFDIRQWSRELTLTDMGAYDRDATSGGLSDDATLSEITLDAEPLTGFSSGTLDYFVQLPYGSTVYPTASGTPTHANATLVVDTPGGSPPGVISLEVTAEDGVTTLTYTVTCTVALSDDATLSDLKVDGETIENFNPAVVSYLVILPRGTTVVPTVTYTKNDPEASAVLSEATELPGFSTVEVTAADGVTIVTYTVVFIFSESSLLSISYAGKAISGFSPTQYGYPVVLPYGTGDIPEVTAVPTGEASSVVITQALSLPGTATIEVTSGAETTLYEVHFTVIGTAPPEGIYIESEYFSGVTKTYSGILTAIRACTPLVKDEVVVLNTLSTLSSVWFAQSNETEFSLKIQAGTIPLAASQRARIVDTGSNRVGMSIEQFSNLELIGIDFDGGGGMGGVKIGPTKAFNVVFRDCVFRNGDYGFYLYAGEGLEFYDCRATDFCVYGFHFLSYRDVILDNCEVVFGTLPTGKTWSLNAQPIYISGGDTLLIRNSRFMDSSRSFQYHCKVTNVVNLRIESCTFTGAGLYSFWFTGSGDPYSCENVVIQDCLFEGNQLSPTTFKGAFLFEKVYGLKFIHNTVVETQVVSFLWDTYDCRLVEFVNNYFHVTRSSTTAYVVVRIRGNALGIPSEIVVKNNYYDLVSVSSAWILLSVSGSGMTTRTYATVAAAQVYGFESGSGSDVGDAVVLKVDASSIPLSGGPLVGMASTGYKTTYDYRWYRKGASPNDTGAGELDAAEFTEEQHTLSFTFQNLEDNLFYTTGSGSVDVPAMDSLCIRLNPVYNRYENQIIVRSRVSPVPVKRTTPSDIVVSGNHLLHLNTPCGLSIIQSNNNDGYYTRPLLSTIIYDAVEDETIIGVNEALTEEGGSGLLQWTNYQISARGNVVKFSLSQRYSRFDLILVSRKPGFEDVIIYKEDFIQVIQQRPVPNFRLSAHTLFPGDAVSFTSISIGCDEIAWEIDHPGGTIYSTASEVSDVVYNTVGEYTVRLTGTNSTPFSRTLTRVGVLKVLETPTRPFIQYHASKEVLFHTRHPSASKYAGS